MRRVIKNSRDAHCPDRDAPLFLDLQSVQNLLISVSICLGGYCAGKLEEPIGEGGFPMIDLHAA